MMINEKAAPKYGTKLSVPATTPHRMGSGKLKSVIAIAVKTPRQQMKRSEFYQLFHGLVDIGYRSLKISISVQEIIAANPDNEKCIGRWDVQRDGPWRFG
ncbi:MAG: hypothetical protein WBR24_00195 [Desulfobacterales bacterium]